MLKYTCWANPGIPGSYRGSSMGTSKPLSGNGVIDHRGESGASSMITIETIDGAKRGEAYSS